MNKEFIKLVKIYLIIAMIFPIAMNFLIVCINFIPSAGTNSEMMSAYSSYFGGLMGGLATLITIYYTFLKSKKDEKPIMYFNNTSFILYSSEGHGTIYSYSDDTSSDKQIRQDDIFFKLTNVGKYPALDVKLKTDTSDYLKSIEKLIPSNETFKKVEKSYVMESMKEDIADLIKGSSDEDISMSLIFRHLIVHLIFVLQENKKNKIGLYSLTGIDEFKLFDYILEFKDINNKPYSEKFSVNIKLYSEMQITSKLEKYTPWKVKVEFVKYK